MDSTSWLQYNMHLQLNITAGLVQTIFHAPAECWCTEMEQVLSPFKRFTATQKPLVDGATNIPGEWQTIILINISGKILISTAI